MKTLAVVTIAVGISVWGAEGAGVEQSVLVCMDLGMSAPAGYLARATASKMFEPAGVRIDWRPSGYCRKAAGAIQISLSYDTPADEFPKALAYARPFEGARIVVFYDRVQCRVEPAIVPDLLAHVLVHEITHILEGTDVHSASGVMKAVWGRRDYANMYKHLGFTEQDIFLIHRGLDARASTVFPAGATPLRSAH